MDDSRIIFFGLRLIAGAKDFFRSLFVIFVSPSLLGFVYALTHNYPVSVWSDYLIMILESTLLSLPLLMITAYLLHCCGEKVRSRWLFRAVLGLWAVFVVVVIFAQFAGIFYSYMPDGQYYRGAWYPAALLPMAAAMLLTIAGMIRWRERLSHKAFMSFTFTLLHDNGRAYRAEVHRNLTANRHLYCPIRPDRAGLMPSPASARASWFCIPAQKLHCYCECRAYHFGA